MEAVHFSSYASGDTEICSIVYPPNPKIIPEQNSHSPPVGNKNHDTISPMVVGEMMPNEGDRSQDTVEQNSEWDLVEDEGERRNSIGTSVHVDTSEPQVAPQQEVPQGCLKCHSG